MNWENEARHIVRSELVRRGVTYAQLSKKLQRIGVAETERAIANKMSRGTFPFTFYLQCMAALGVEKVSFELVLQDSGADPVVKRTFIDDGS